MTDEQQETIVNEVLRKLCHYLNLWWDAEDMNKDESGPYTLKNFTVWDPERSLYGVTNWKVLEELEEGTAFPTALLRVETSDGDEGGGSILYVGLRGENLTIDWIMHIFDLQPVLMYTDEEGYRIPPKGEMAKW